MAFATNDSGTSLGVGFGANSTTLAFAITSDMQIAWHERQGFLWKSGAQGIRIRKDASQLQPQQWRTRRTRKSP